LASFSICCASHGRFRSAKRSASACEPPRGTVTRATPSGRNRSTYRRARRFRTNTIGICLEPTARKPPLAWLRVGRKRNSNCTESVKELRSGCANHSGERTRYLRSTESISTCGDPLEFKL
jgi:hypothetical protein